MAGEIITVMAGVTAGSKMPAERGSMGNYSGAIAGQSKARSIDQPEPYGRENSKDGKNLQQGVFQIIRSRFAIYDVMDDVFGGDSTEIFWLF